MRAFVAFAVIVASACGEVLFYNIYKDETELPKDQTLASNQKWQPVPVLPEDKRLNIEWYEQQGNPVQLAYDGNKGLSGVRIVIPKNGENDFYANSNIFKEVSISDKTYYISTVFVTDPEILEAVKGGRLKTEDDEIVESIHVQVKKGTEQSTERIQRNACDNAEQGIFLEQGCKNQYGLVFAPLKAKDETCDYPLFLVYNEVEQGEMLGFGWLVPAAGLSGSTALADDDVKTMFPSKPACLRGKTAITVWLAKDDTRKEKCAVPKGKFVELRCQKKRRTGFSTFSITRSFSQHRY